MKRLNDHHFISLLFHYQPYWSRLVTDQNNFQHFFRQSYKLYDVGVDSIQGCDEVCV